MRTQGRQSKVSDVLHSALDRKNNANGNDYRMIAYLQAVGFAKEKEIAFPHKQAALMKVGREGWQAPEI